MKDPKKEIKKRFLKLMRTAIAEQWNGVKTEGQFADAIGVFPQQVYHIKTEDGRHVTVEMINNICQTFGVDANYFFSAEAPMKKQKMPAEEKIKKIQRILAE